MKKKISKKAKRTFTRPDMRKILRMILPGVKGKVAIITGLFVTCALVASAFFTYIHEGKILEDSLARETESALLYIDGVVMEMDNVRNNILLVENMRLRIEKKQKEMNAYRHWYYRKSDNFANTLKSFGRKLGMQVSYDYQLASSDTYYSVYLSDAQIKAVEKSLIDRLKKADGSPISDPEFRDLQKKARYVAASQIEIDRLEQLASDSQRASADEKDAKKKAASLADAAQYKSYAAKYHKSRQYYEKIFRSQLKTYYEYDLRRMEDLGLIHNNIRVLTYDRYGDTTYDTGIFNNESLSRFGDLTADERYSKDKTKYFEEAPRKLSVDKRADFNYLAGNRSYSVRYLPVYRNPATFGRVALILSELDKHSSDWKDFIKEDARIASQIGELSEKMRIRLAELRKTSTPPAKDDQYASLHAQYRGLLAVREKGYENYDPYKDEPDRIADEYTLKIKALLADITASQKKIEAVMKSPKKPEEITEETDRIRNGITETRAQIAALEEGRLVDRNDIGRSTRLSASDAFRHLRDAALLDFSAMRQKHNPKTFSSYLKSPDARTVESRRWNTLRSWVGTAKSESDLPEFVPGTRIPIIEGGILAWSRTEVEEYMMKLDSTPLADTAGLFGAEAAAAGLLGTLLTRDEMGYNAVLIDKTDGLKQINESRRMTLIFTGIIALLGVISTYFLAGLMVRRIKLISEQSKEARGGNLEITFPETGLDEIADMGVSLNAMIEGLKEREELKGELSAAAEIQKQLLPETIPPTLDGEYSIGRLYVSMMGVGGDYYDFIELDENKLFFCIGDVSNHGVGPAMVMAMVRAHLHGIIKNGERDLAKILLILNQRIFDETPPQIFVTFFIGIVDKESNELTYCSAGHLKPVVFRHKTEKTERLEAGGLPLGMDSNELFSQTIQIRSTTMKPGDLFFQFTDGLSEAMNEKREIFTEERLVAEVEKAAKKKVDVAIKMIAAAVGDYAKKDLLAASGMTDLDDDCAMVAIKRLK
jgi:serine phosphatase RsbU (regulator of sigma subunit)